MQDEELIASIRPGMCLTKDFLRSIYAKGMSDPQFPDRAIGALEAAGCSRAGQYYEDWVNEYETEREAMLKEVARWYRLECEREWERKVGSTIAGNRSAGYQFNGFPEDW